VYAKALLRGSFSAGTSRVRVSAMGNVRNLVWAGLGGRLKIPVVPISGIPKGCEKVARGKRSAAPGSVAKKDPRPGGTPDQQISVNREGSRALSGARVLRERSRRCASLAPGYLPASLRDARSIFETASYACPWLPSCIPYGMPEPKRRAALYRKIVGVAWGGMDELSG